uniref:AlkB homolog 3, alpha-ketoglutaratedependent dioxygenase n=1 Tax=Stegastes partitus TaxID=144197 RepID=A0A3B5BJF2_9TELE
MSDKRQRARVQGSWAKQLPKHSGPTGSTGLTVAVPNNHQPKDATTASGSWGIRSQQTSKNFEFHQPSKPVRDVPPEKVIEKTGDYEISQGPSGVSRLRLLPGFLPPEEADWIFSKLLAELPWSQKTNYRQDKQHDEDKGLRFLTTDASCVILSPSFLRLCQQSPCDVWEKLRKK